MNPALIALVAGGNVASAISGYKQSMRERKYIKRQALEIENQKAFATEMGTRQQFDVIEQEESAIGANIAATAKSGLRVGSQSSQARREALRGIYGRQRETIGLQTQEQLRQMTVEQLMLKKRSRDVGRAAKLNLITSLIGAGAQAGQGAYKAGLFSGKNNNISTYQQPLQMNTVDTMWNQSAPGIYTGVQPIRM